VSNLSQPCKITNGVLIICICDAAPMRYGTNFTTIDETTNLVTLSEVTRRRVVPLVYALQVAHAHKGRLELLLWPEDKLAVRFILPQAAANM
ncbi:MAG: hypothetical protein ACOYNL_07725, partial [Rickettsiales bacterium]